MLVGRVIGLVLIALAAIMASADAVMALGPAEYAGIVTSDVLTLLTGDAMEASQSGLSMLSALRAMVLHLPAWVVVGLLGFTLMAACRKRQRRYRFRR